PPCFPAHTCRSRPIVRQRSQPFPFASRVPAPLPGPEESQAMYKHSRWLVLLVGCALAGCNSSTTQTTPDETPKPGTLSDSSDVSLSELLGKSRPELAGMVDEWATKVQLQEKAQREKQKTIALLPDLRIPHALPVFREARFIPSAGFS